MTSRLFLVGSALAATLAATGCGEKPPAAAAVTDAWLRLPAVPGHPAAGYATVHAGEAAERLLSVTSPEVATIEMHRTMAGSNAGMSTEPGTGMTSMAPLDGLAVPAGGAASFQPGGNHLMLMGVDPAVTPGARIDLHFTFASGRTLDAQAQAVGPGDPAPVPRE